MLCADFQVLFKMVSLKMLNQCSNPVSLPKKEATHTSDFFHAKHQAFSKPMTFNCQDAKHIHSVPAGKDSFYCFSVSAHRNTTYIGSHDHVSEDIGLGAIQSMHLFSSSLRASPQMAELILQLALEFSFWQWDSCWNLETWLRTAQ